MSWYGRETVKDSEIERVGEKRERGRQRERVTCLCVSKCVSASMKQSANGLALCCVQQVSQSSPILSWAGPASEGLKAEFWRWRGQGWGGGAVG